MISSCPMKNAKKPSCIYSVKSQRDTDKKSVSSRTCTSHRSSKHSSEKEESGSTEEQDTDELNIVEENQDSKLLKLNRFIRKTPMKILIDSRATRSFIATRYTKKLKLKTRKKEIARSVVSADGSEQIYIYMVHDVCIKIGEYVERLPLNVIKLQFYDVIFGKS